MIGRRHSKRPHVFSFLLLAGIVCVLGALVWIFLPRNTNPYGRETYIIVSDPMIIASWGLSDNVLTLIALPSDIAAEGTHGYGMYSLDALWRLGEIDNKDGTVLAESISEALGIPVDGYIGPEDGGFTAGPDILTTVKTVFSLKRIPAFFTRRFRTEIALPTFMSLAWRLNFSRPDRVAMYDFTRNTAAVAQDVLLPDGSGQQVLDSERVDSQLQAVFEDESVRQESVTVAVYNTTAMPSLGNRVGRILTNLGVSVVTVGNDSPELETCTVTGNDSARQSKSAQVIISVFGCTSVSGDAYRADLILRIGKSYAKRFLPN